jgi:germination protein M
VAELTHRPKLVALLPIIVVATGCGRTETVTVTRTETVVRTVTEPSRTQTARVYFLRDGKVTAFARQVDQTRAVATETLRVLFDGITVEDHPDSGLRNELPKGQTFSALRMDGGTASVELSGMFSRKALAQVVYTLTQFPTVRAVNTGGKTYTRAHFEDLTPAILVESPLPFQAVSAPLRVTGTANTFEATFEYELLDPAGKVLSKHFETATSGSGTRGTFDFTVPFEAPNGLGKLVVFERSAGDGSRIHQVEIPLRLAR